MHTTIDYSNKSSNHVIDDLKDWFGEEKFASLSKLFQEEFKESPSSEHFSMLCSIAGVQGYPVRVWYEYLWGRTLSDV